MFIQTQIKCFLGIKGKKEEEEEKKAWRREKGRKGGREPASVVANERWGFSDKDCHLVEL